MASQRQVLDRLYTCDSAALIRNPRTDRCVQISRPLGGALHAAAEVLRRTAQLPECPGENEMYDAREGQCTSDTSRFSALRELMAQFQVAVLANDSEAPSLAAQLVTSRAFAKALGTDAVATNAAARKSEDQLRRSTRQYESSLAEARAQLANARARLKDRDSNVASLRKQLANARDQLQPDDGGELETLRWQLAEALEAAREAAVQRNRNRGVLQAEIDQLRAELADSVRTMQRALDQRNRNLRNAQTKLANSQQLLEQLAAAPGSGNNRKALQAEVDQLRAQLAAAQAPEQQNRNLLNARAKLLNSQQLLKQLAAEGAPPRYATVANLRTELANTKTQLKKAENALNKARAALLARPDPLAKRPFSFKNRIPAALARPILTRPPLPVQNQTPPQAAQGANSQLSSGYNSNTENLVAKLTARSKKLGIGRAIVQARERPMNGLRVINWNNTTSTVPQAQKATPRTRPQTRSQTRLQAQKASNTIAATPRTRRPQTRSQTRSQAGNTGGTSRTAKVEAAREAQRLEQEAKLKVKQARAAEKERLKQEQRKAATAARAARTAGVLARKQQLNAEQAAREAAAAPRKNKPNKKASTAKAGKNIRTAMVEAAREAQRLEQEAKLKVKQARAAEKERLKQEQRQATAAARAARAAGVLARKQQLNAEQAAREAAEKNKPNKKANKKANTGKDAKAALHDRRQRLMAERKARKEAMTRLNKNLAKKNDATVMQVLGNMSNADRIDLLSFVEQKPSQANSDRRLQALLRQFPGMPNAYMA